MSKNTSKISYSLSDMGKLISLINAYFKVNKNYFSFIYTSRNGSDEAFLYCKLIPVPYSQIHLGKREGKQYLVIPVSHECAQNDEFLVLIPEPVECGLFMVMDNEELRFVLSNTLGDKYEFRF